MEVRCRGCRVCMQGNMIGLTHCFVIVQSVYKSYEIQLPTLLRELAFPTSNDFQHLTLIPIIPPPP